jgi:hypothetical protein
MGGCWLISEISSCTSSLHIGEIITALRTCGARGRLYSTCNRFDQDKSLSIRNRLPPRRYGDIFDSTWITEGIRLVFESGNHIWEGDTDNFIKTDSPGDAILLAGNLSWEKFNNGILAMCVDGCFFIQIPSTHNYYNEDVTLL